MSFEWWYDKIGEGIMDEMRRTSMNNWTFLGMLWEPARRSG
jgi:hypothetical protein